MMVGEGFDLKIGPAQTCGAVAPRHGLTRPELLDLLLDRLHFTESAAIRYADAAEAGTNLPLLNQWLSDKDAAALGWRPEYRR